MQSILYRVTVLKFDRPSINERELPTRASATLADTSAWCRGQREIGASETNNYKHVINIGTTITSVRQIETIL